MIELVRPDAKGLAIILLFIVFFLQSVIIEPNSISVTENSFDILEESGPVKIVFISDIHAGLQSDEHLRRAVDSINSLEPDMVLIGGDSIEAEEWELEKLQPLAELDAPHRYAVLGNHDYGFGYGDNSVADSVDDKLEDMDISVLRNEHEIIDIRGERFALIGVDDEWAGRNDYAAASAGIPDEMPKVVLAHNELAVDAEEVKGESVVLSGHTHCGQVNVPVITKLFFGPGFGDVINGRATLDEDTELYVTCGIAQGGIRLFAPPEISIIQLE